MKLEISKSVSVVIPTFEGKELLEMYLPSLFRTLQTSARVSSYEVIVVDDASSDDTELFLQKKYPEVVFIKNDENSGFSKTSNRGLQRATCDLVLFLNNDMVLNDDFFDKTIPFFNQDDTFGVFSEIRDSEGIKKLEGQKLPVITRCKIHYADNVEASQCDISTTKSNPYSFYICGGNMLVSRKKMIELQGFNEIYSPFYFEDFDVSLRAWRNGWFCYYTAETFSKHCHSTTIKKKFSADYVQTIFIRNRLIFNCLQLSFCAALGMHTRVLLKIILYSIVPIKSQQTYKRAAISYLKMHRSIMRNKKLFYTNLNSIDSFLSCFENK